MSTTPSKSTAHAKRPDKHEFPYFQHISLLGILTVLLGFTAVYLPAGSTYFTTLPPQQSSLDKPQHPILVPITASPELTLFWLCAGVAVCQAWFGGYVRSWWSHYPHFDIGISKIAVINSLILQKGKSLFLWNAFLNTIVAALSFHLLIIGFGAPIISHIFRTFLLSLLLSLLVVFIPSYALSLPFLLSNTDDARLNRAILMRFFGQRRLTTPLERSVVYPCYFVFFGSWLGAIPIALDWDRPWQAWPLTPAYGALVGYVLGLWLVSGANIFLRLAKEGSHSVPSKKKQG